MSIYDIVANILNLIQNKNYKTKDAISECFQIYNISKNDKDLIYKIVYTYLNHFAYIDYVLEVNLNLQEKNLSYFLLCSILILKRYLKKNITLKEYENILFQSYYNDSINRQVKQDFYNLICQEKLISNELSLNRRLSIYYNYPINLIRYIKRVFTPDVVKKLLMAKDQTKPYFAINAIKAKIQDYENDPRFVLIKNKNELLQDLAMIQLEQPIRASQMEDLKQGYIFPLDFSVAKVLDDIKYHPFDDVILMTATTGNITSYLKIFASKNVGKMTAVFLRDVDLSRSKSLYNRLGIDVESILLKDISHLEADVERQSKDVVFVNLDNSSIGMMKRRKEVLLNLDLSKLQEENLQNIYKTLDEGYNLVKDNGRLVYMTKSFFEFETKNVIKKLLEKYKDLTLIKEKLILPYEYDCDGIYYAIMKRNAK